MLGMKPYNYRTFTRDLLLKDLAKGKFSGGPKPGECAPDFEGRTLDGDVIRLSDYEGEKNVVLMFGSATCPMTAASIRGMNDLYEEFNGKDVQFLFCYVREAHPGDDLPAHESIDDKIAAAELLREEDDVEMPILIDDLRGSIHRKYGKMPNATFLIDKSGRVAFRCLWTQPSIVQEALEELVDRQDERGVEHAIVHGGEHTSFPVRHTLLHTHRALDRGGDQAIRNFEQVMGLPGRLTVLSSRVVAPVALNPGKALLGAMLAGGVVAGALYAGFALRRRRLGRQTPYDIHNAPTRRTGTGDYEAVGI